MFLVCAILMVNSYTIYLVGKVLHMMHEFYEMLCEDLIG
ncbi:hypothetical protein LINPERPRIM_LOCUS5397 [Linum perenne]